MQTRHIIIVCIGSFVLGAGIVGSCKPSYKKELTVSQKETKEVKDTLTAVREQNTSLTQLNQAYENHQRVRTAEKLALDGTGTAVYDILPNGSKKAVILKTVTILTGSSGSSSSLILETQLKESLLRETGYKSAIDSLKHELIEKRSGFDLLASYGTGNTVGLTFLPPPVGILRAGISGQLGLSPNPRGLEVLAVAGVHFQ